MPKTQIQLLLWQRGISQRSLAQQMGLTPKRLSEKLSGKAPLWWREVVIIAQALELDNPLTEFFPLKQ